MKKILAITLACLMALTLAVSVSAADIAVNNNETLGVDVKVHVNASAAETHVTVDWTSTEFTYIFNKTWDEAAHEDVISSAGWTTDGRTIANPADGSATATLTIKNHSNKQITVGATYNPADLGENASKFTNVNVSLSALSKTTLDAATSGTVDSATTTLTIIGAPAEGNIDTSVRIGTISISIS